MQTAIYPGSFDPPTNGHLDIIKRAASLVDRLIVGVLINSAKTPLFTMDERVEMLAEITKDIPNDQVRSFEGLLVDFAREQNAKLLIRGLRAVTDYEFELQLAQSNKAVCSDVDTIFLVTSAEYSFLSSSIVRDIARYGGDNGKFVPDFVDMKLKEKFKNKGEEK